MRRNYVRGAAAMDRHRPSLDQINIVSANPEASIAFYRRLGVDITEDGIWRTPSGIHHVNASRYDARSTLHFDIDSIAFARLWNTGWRGTADLRGRVAVGLMSPPSPNHRSPPPEV